MSPNICRSLLRRLVLPLVLASLPLQAETLQYAVPPFQSRAWHPEKTETVTVPAVWGWVTRPGATRTIDPPPYDIPTTYKFITWPAEYGTIVVPDYYDLRHVPPVMGTRTVEYTVTVPESGHIEPAVPESTETREETRTWVEEVWRDTSYEELVFLDGYDEYDNYWWWEGWITIPDGYIDYESRSETVTVTYTIPGSPETYVVDIPEHEETRTREEIYEVSPGRDEYYLVTPEHTEQVLVREAGSATVVDVQGRTVDDPPYEVTDPDWQEWVIIVAEHEEETTTPGFWENVTVPETTLTVNTNDVDDITWLTWSAQGYKHDGRFDVEVPSIQVPFCVDRLLVDQNWIAEDTEDDHTVWNESMIFMARAGILPSPTGTSIPPPTGQVWRGPDGRWGTRAEIRPVSVLEALAQLDVFLMDVAIKLREKRGEVWSYLTYEKHSLNDPLRRVYAGKTWGIGEPQIVLGIREANHYHQRPDLGPGIINSAMVTRKIEDAAQNSMRGREQSLIDWHDQSGQYVFPHANPMNLGPGIRVYFYDPTSSYPNNYSHSDNMRPSPQTNHPHGTRAVRKDNPDGKTYWEYSAFYFGYLWEFTGDAWADPGTFGIFKPIPSLVSQFVRPPLAWTPP